MRISKFADVEEDYQLRSPPHGATAAARKETRLEELRKGTLSAKLSPSPSLLEYTRLQAQYQRCEKAL